MVVDSSVWIEILSGGELGAACEAQLRSAHPIRVPTLVVYEVYRKMKLLAGEEDALEVIAFLRSHEILDLGEDVAIAAADLSIQRKLPMADSIVLAHAHLLGDQLFTLDNDFHGQPEVFVLRKPQK